MNDFHRKIEAKLDELERRDLTPEEQAVMSMLSEAWEKYHLSPLKITQQDIARHERWMGCHPKHENMATNETTLRKVRQIIRDLRINHAAPILSDRDGYWIPKSHREVQEYLERIERESKAQAAAWFETYRSMERAFGMKSEYFEAQERLFHHETDTQ